MEHVKVEQVAEEESEDDELGGDLEPVESSPDEASAVLARRDDRVAGVGEGAAEHVVRVPRERLHALAGLDRPQARGAVQRGGQQLLPVWTETDCMEFMSIRAYLRGLCRADFK